MLPPPIETQGLSRRFGLHHALRDVTLTLPPATVLLLVGPNGAGKTTLLRLLATALRPSRGGGSVFGHDLVREPDAVRRVTALVGAVGGVYASLTGFENLAFAAAMTGAASGRPDILTLLERVGLGPAGGQPVRTYSQGMRRRLVLARAWLLRPRLLLLDDPYGGMDAEGADLVSALVGEIRAAGGAVVLATHEWERGLTLADRILALVDGRQADAADVQGVSTSRLRAPVGGAA
ncbi:MAG TPA: ATP-binding cassette domain-containing protein [bacterium]|jgi:ABC-2 type transport system ATP-binding protein|nr:ATP-binding cassette domain-containing protein [bacterium]